MKGDEVQHDGLLFQVDSVEGQRIDRLTVTFQPWRRPQPAEDGVDAPQV
jgi:CBS domain containing-hemolysin-like protein